MTSFKPLCFVFAFCLIVTISSAQTNVFYNNGAIVGIGNEVDVYVGFDLRNETTSGFLSNAGRLTVMGDLINNAEMTGGSFQGQPAAPDTGVFNLFGNWENNSFFKADESTVNLKGGNQQISGTSVTTFFNLIASETSNSIKRLDDVDANVAGVFTLRNGVEFATSDNKLNITNNSPAAIAFDNISFVSSTSTGRLTRATASANPYFFPVGWNNSGVKTIRPVMVEPSNSNAAQFDVRFVPANPSIDGFDVGTKQEGIMEVNSKYYHLISQTSGASLQSNLSILYNPQVDGDWASIARWQNIPRWEDLIAEDNSVFSPYFLIGKRLWLGTSDEAHALIKKNEEDKEYEFPSAFSPNNDQTNDRFGLVKGSVATLEGMRIYNRWGELIFDKAREGKDFWDGTYQGKQQPMGTYLMQATVKLKNGELKNETRSISLVY